MGVPTVQSRTWPSPAASCGSATLPDEGGAPLSESPVCCGGMAATPSACSLHETLEKLSCSRSDSVEAMAGRAVYRYLYVGVRDTSREHSARAGRGGVEDSSDIRAGAWRGVGEDSQRPSNSNRMQRIISNRRRRKKATASRRGWARTNVEGQAGQCGGCACTARDGHAARCAAVAPELVWQSTHRH